VKLRSSRRVGGGVVGRGASLPRCLEKEPGVGPGAGGILKCGGGRDPVAGYLSVPAQIGEKNTRGERVMTLGGGCCYLRRRGIPWT